jgi:hypothetical protein
MTPSVSPSDALSPEAFYSLYLGGLALESDRRRRDACYVLLSMGRLGLRPGELGHMHEDWIDWRRGEVNVPARDPCACRECWKRASRRQERGDDRSLEAIVRADCWSPPEGERAARSLPFGWSRRLAAALDGVLGERPYLDADRPQIEALLREAAENAWDLDPEAVSPATLRATAGEFLATAGFGPRRLADLLVVDEETAGEFARVGGGELREYMYRSLGPDRAPEICGGDSPYRLVCDPAPFDREPFDPREYDARWRDGRADDTDRRGRNPRQPAPPADSSFSVSDLELEEPAADSGSELVSASLSDWVKRRESQRRQYAESGATGADGSPDAAYRDWVTAPVRYSVSTRFAGQGIESGRPTGGSVVLGQRELVFLSRDETGVADALRVDFDSVVDVVPGYVPGPLKGAFDETIGIARRDENGDRKVLVCELPDQFAWEAQQTIFASLLEGVETVFANLSSGTTDPEDIEPERRELTATSRTIKIEDPDTEALPMRIRLSTIVGIEEKPMTTEVGYEMGLTLHHLQVNANVAVVEVRPVEDNEMRFLKRYLMEHHKRQKRKARNASLSDDQLEVLDALLDAGPGRDLVAILDMNPSRVSNVVESLREVGLVRDSRTGVALTGTGYLVTSGGSLLYEASDS